jgi:hypothetical protein
MVPPTVSTGAFWLDLTFVGIGLITAPAFIVIALLIHPAASLPGLVGPGMLVLGLFGLLSIVLGMWYGKRTHWRVPDPDVAKAK